MPESSSVITLTPAAASISSRGPTTTSRLVARDIPTADESMVIIRFRDPRGVDFPYLLRKIDGSFMSRANTIVVPGGKLDLAMQLILTPLIWKLMKRRRQGV